MQTSESSPVRDRCSTTESHNQLLSLVALGGDLRACMHVKWELPFFSQGGSKLNLHLCFEQAENSPIAVYTLQSQSDMLQSTRRDGGISCRSKSRLHLTHVIQVVSTCIHFYRLSPSTYYILCRRQNSRHGYMYPLVSGYKLLAWDTCIDGYMYLV